jgi:hypothetical protein
VANFIKIHLSKNHSLIQAKDKKLKVLKQRKVLGSRTKDLPGFLNIWKVCESLEGIFYAEDFHKQFGFYFS